jgi:hypothetical protein
MKGKTMIKKQIVRNEILYTRRVLRLIEKKLLSNDWDDIQQATLELSAVWGTVEDRISNPELYED